jgi:hypothetical protein
VGNFVNQPVSRNEANEQFEMCCGENGICSHEVLRDGESDSGSKMVRKVVFSIPPIDKCWLFIRNSMILIA